MSSIHKQVGNALKWSSLGEIVAKLITPLSNIILARLLTPEIFGIVATITMIISFADMFSDSGFQKYLVQHNFDNQNQLEESANVAFSSNFLISIILWILICLFNRQISVIVGNPGLGFVIIVAGLSLPITSFSSIHASLFKRNLDFRILFYARILSALVPVFITVPLAIIGMSYWSLIIGNLVGSIVISIVLSYLSEWKPRLMFNMNAFQDMFSFSVWSLFESLGTWLSSYIGTFVVGSILSQYYLGLYKTSMTTVNGIFAIITSATVSVLFTSLSRLQNDREKYDSIYLEFINLVSIIIFPIGVGIFIYRSLVTRILLGEQWIEATSFVGIYGLMCCLTLVLGQFASEYFRGLGKPKANVLMTFLHLIVLIPTLILSSRAGFVTLTYASSLVKFQQILVYWLILWFGFRFNPIDIFKHVWKGLFSSIIMGLFGYFFLQLNSGIIFQLVSIIVCIIIYFINYVYLFKGKGEIIQMIKVFAGI
ncbi:lipopolysaccharide biosynthesis protein [Streptococcus parasuis]